jgi:hypothetical protein
MSPAPATPLTPDDPTLALDASPPPVLARAFARLDALAMGVATGAVAGLAVGLATVWLVLKGGAVVGPNLSLLAQYFPGFSVSWTGAAIGLAYAAAVGFAAGWAYAALRNVTLRHVLRHIRARGAREAERRFLDYVG